MEKTNGKLRQALEILFSHQAYRIVLLIMVTLRSSHLLSVYVGPLVKFTLVWSAAILLKDLFTQRLLFTNRWRGLLYIFLILYGITSLYHYQENLARNIAMLCYMATNLMLFYAYDLSKPRESVKREIWNLSHTFMILTFCGNLLTMAAFVLNVHLPFTYTSGGVEETSWLGFYSGRMWGFFSNPNTGGDIAIINLMLMTVCLVMMGKAMPKGWKRFYAVNLVVQSIVFFLSNSRTAWMCIIFFILALPFLALLFQLPEKMKEQPVKKVLKRTAALALVAVFAFTGIDGFAKSVLPNLIVPTTYFTERLLELSGVDTEDAEKTAAMAGIPTDLERDDYGSFLGGRYYLWKAGVGITVNHPLLGVSAENIEAYANEYAAWPQTYEQAEQAYLARQEAAKEKQLLETYKSMKKAEWADNFGQAEELAETMEQLEQAEIPEYEPYLPGISGGLHNMIFQMAASSGLPALLVIGIMAFGFLILLIKYYIYAFRQKKVMPLIVAMTAFILVFLVRSMSETGLIYGISYSSILFWSFVSYTMYFIEKETAGEPSFEKGRNPLLARLSRKVFSGKKGR